MAKRVKIVQPPLDLDLIIIERACGCRMASNKHPEWNVCCSEHWIWWSSSSKYITDLFYTKEDWEREKIDERYRELIAMGRVR